MGMNPVSIMSTLHTANEAAAILRTSRRQLTNHVNSGKLGFIKIGRSIRFRADELERFIEAHTVKPKGWKEPRKVAIRIGSHVG